MTHAADVGYVSTRASQLLSLEHLYVADASVDASLDLVDFPVKYVPCPVLVRVRCCRPSRPALTPACAGRLGVQGAENSALQRVVRVSLVVHWATALGFGVPDHYQ